MARGGDNRKTRADSVLDDLSPEQREAVFAYCERVSLEKGIAWLKAEFDIEVSDSTLSKWLGKVRHEKKFATRLDQIAVANQRAGVVATTIGDALQLSQANILMLNQALMDAQIAGDDKAVKKAILPLVMLIEAVAKNKKADADVQDAETARSKFQFDAAKAALAAAADLQEISRSKGSEREKVERAVKRLFGEKPAHVLVGKDGAASE